MGNVRTGVLLRFLRLSHRLAGLVAGPFQALAAEDVSFPCFHELAQVGLLRLERSWTAEALETSILEEAGIEAIEDEELDIAEALADLGLDPDFLDAWHDVTALTGRARGAVGATIAFLRTGTYDVMFFPWNPATDRAPLLFVFFRVHSVAGVYVAEEPFVDPVGWFV